MCRWWLYEGGRRRYNLPMLSAYLRKIVKILVFVVVVGTPLFYFKPGVYPASLGKTAFFQIAVELLFFSWLGLAILDRRFRPRFTPLVVSGGILLVAFAITGALGVDSWRSFWSTQERALGIFALFHMAAFALVVSSLGKDLPVKRVLAASTTAAVLVAVIALLEGVGSRPGSTFGNPAFLGGYLVLSFLFALYLILDVLKRRESAHSALTNKERAKLGLLIAAAAFFTAVLFITETRGSILAFGVALIVLGGLFVVRPPESRVAFLGKRSFYLALIGAAMLLGISFWFTRSSVLWSTIPGLDRFANVSLSSMELQPRISAIRAAWKSFLDHPATGLGWENFNIGFNKYYDSAAPWVSYLETRFDKPHNFALEVLSVGGLTLALAYLVFYGAYAFTLWRIGSPLFAQTTTALLVGYIVHGAFLFETLGTMLLVFLVAGIVDGAYRARREAVGTLEEASLAHPEAKEFPATSREPEPGVLRKRLALGAALVAVIPIYFVNIPSLAASYYQAQGFRYYAQQSHFQSRTSFKKAITLRNPYLADIKKDYAIMVAGVYFYHREAVTQEEALEAVGTLEETSLAHPEDAFYHYTLVDLYNQIVDINPEIFLPAAEAEATKALELSPNRQQIYFSLARTRYLAGKRAEALTLAKKGLDLNPRVPDGHFYYGLLNFVTGKPDVGYAEIKKAIELRRPWKDYNEPRVVANYFADYRKFDEAIELYKKALELYDGDLEARAKLAVVYYLVGDKASAKLNFEKALEKGEFISGPSYQSVLPALKELGLVK